jgi:hypothetical protein
VQQDDRRAIAALEHGGRDTGQLQPALGNGQCRQQPFPGIVARGRLPREFLGSFVRDHGLFPFAT